MALESLVEMVIILMQVAAVPVQVADWVDCWVACLARPVVLADSAVCWVARVSSKDSKDSKDSRGRPVVVWVDCLAGY